MPKYASHECAIKTLNLILLKILFEKIKKSKPSVFIGNTINKQSVIEN